MSVFNRKGPFSDNTKALAVAQGRPANQTPWKLIRLKNAESGQVMDLAARPGKFVSAAFLEWLGHGKTAYCVADEWHEVVRDFFGPLWDQPGHATIDFLKGAVIEVELQVSDSELEDRVNDLWERRDHLDPIDKSDGLLAVEKATTLLDYGVYRVAEPDSSVENGWRVNQWLKQAILLGFKLRSNEVIEGPGKMNWWDKVPQKLVGTAQDFTNAGFRAVPGSFVRHGAFVGKDCILMPSFINIGAFVDDGTMVDTWATVGSCAQIGKRVHLSGGVGIGGVLEPMQANPVIIEDGAFIGARSEVVEGVIVRKGAVLSMGVFVGKNTPIVDRTQGNRIIRGEIPENAVVFMGFHPENGLVCPQIVKYRDPKTDAATALNEILRG